MRRVWERFRSWPAWVQWTIGILVGLIMIGALTDTREDDRTLSSGATTTQFSSPPTPTTSTTRAPTTVAPTTPVPTAAPQTTAAPAGPRTTFGPGQYRVGTDIAPGTYIAPGGSLCYWERQATFGGASPDSIIANDVSSGGQVLVTIAASDKGFKTSGCGTWTPG